MKNLFSVLVSFLLVSCTSIHDVTKSTEFSSEIGERILLKAAFICEDNDRAMFERDLPSNMVYENHGFKSCPLGKHVATLDKGVKINVTEVSNSSHFALVSHTDHWYLIGSTKIEDKKVKFYFYLGLTTDGNPPIDYKKQLLWH